MRRSRVLQASSGVLIAVTVGQGIGVTRSPAAASLGPPVGAIVKLAVPGALAVGARGQLYVANPGSNQVLELEARGDFRDVAGNGRSGFSGDGGPAVDAELDDPTGLVVAPGGALYIADRGNGRVREVLPDGTITTVAGVGPGGWSSAPEPARSARLNAITALALSPNGDLYLGGDELSVLKPNGIVYPLVQSSHAPPCGIPNAATFTDVNSIALDARGDVIVANNLCHEIAELTPRGMMLLVVRSGNGSGVSPIASDGFGVVYRGGEGISPVGARVIETIKGFDADTILSPHGIFMVHHMTVASSVTIYVDEQGDSWSSVSAIAEVPLSGGARLVWES